MLQQPTAFATAISVCLVLVANRCATAASAAGEIVYDAGSVQPAGGIGASYEFGEQIVLAGTRRAIRSFTLPVFTNDLQSTSFDFQLRFYINDGPFDAPGTLLWASPVLDNLMAAPSGSLVEVSVPNVVVPDSFTWTAITSDNSLEVYREWNYSLPVVGTFVRGWRWDLDRWTTDRDMIPQQVQIVAVPEPSSIVAMVSAALLLLLARTGF